MNEAKLQEAQKQLDWLREQPHNDGNTHLHQANMERALRLIVEALLEK